MKHVTIKPMNIWNQYFNSRNALPMLRDIFPSDQNLVTLIWPLNMSKTFIFKDSHNLHTRIYRWRERPCYILVSWGGMHWKLSQVFPFVKRNWLITLFFKFWWSQQKRILVCKIHIFYVNKTIKSLINFFSQAISLV